MRKAILFLAVAGLALMSFGARAEAFFSPMLGANHFNFANCKGNGCTEVKASTVEGAFAIRGGYWFHFVGLAADFEQSAVLEPDSPGQVDNRFVGVDLLFRLNPQGWSWYPYIGTRFGSEFTAIDLGKCNHGTLGGVFGIEQAPVKHHWTFGVEGSYRQTHHIFDEEDTKKIFYVDQNTADLFVKAIYTF